MKNPAPLFLGAGLLLLVALFWLFKPAAPVAVATPLPLAPTLPVGSAAPVMPVVPAETVFEFALAGGQLTQAPAALRVIEGERLRLVIRSDHDDELHVHGYDLSAAIKAGEPASLAFTAAHSGRFALELHHAEIELGALEVLPAP